MMYRFAYHALGLCIGLVIVLLTDWFLGAVGVSALIIFFLLLLGGASSMVWALLIADLLGLLPLGLWGTWVGLAYLVYFFNRTTKTPTLTGLLWSAVSWIGLMMIFHIHAPFLSILSLCIFIVFYSMVERRRLLRWRRE